VSDYALPGVGQACQRLGHVVGGPVVYHYDLEVVVVLPEHASDGQPATPGGRESDHRDPHVAILSDLVAPDQLDASLCSSSMLMLLALHEGAAEERLFAALRSA
jgi:hypothetical protein